MLNLALLLVSLYVAPPAPKCEAARLLDGRTVTMCQGRVVSVRDDMGNARLYPLAD